MILLLLKVFSLQPIPLSSELAEFPSLTAVEGLHRDPFLQKVELCIKEVRNFFLGCAEGRALLCIRSHEENGEVVSSRFQCPCYGTHIVSSQRRINRAEAGVLHDPVEAVMVRLRKMEQVALLMDLPGHTRERSSLLYDRAGNVETCHSCTLGGEAPDIVSGTRSRDEDITPDLKTGEKIEEGWRSAPLIPRRIATEIARLPVGIIKPL